MSQSQDISVDQFARISETPESLPRRAMRIPLVRAGDRCGYRSLLRWIPKVILEPKVYFSITLIHSSFPCQYFDIAVMRRLEPGDLGG